LASIIEYTWRNEEKKGENGKLKIIMSSWQPHLGPLGKLGGINKGAHVDTIAMWLKSMKLLIFELCNS
jgi:hypothetical protein